jgi:hypothetical protein
MTDDEIDKMADKMLEAEIARRRAELRAEIARQQRREAAMRHYDEIEARGRQLSEPPSAEEVALRHRLADESLRRDRERVAANEER